jgi:hypothetical protein
MECSGMRESTSRNQANGSTPFRLHMAMKLSSTAAVLPPLSLPKNIQLPPPMAMSRLARSVAPLSISRSLHALALEDLLLPVQGLMVGKLVDHHLRQHARSGRVRSDELPCADKQIVITTGAMIERMRAIMSAPYHPRERCTI